MWGLSLSHFQKFQEIVAVGVTLLLKHRTIVHRTLLNAITGAFMFTIFFLFSTCLSFSKYFSVIQLLGLLLSRFGILLLFRYIFILFPTSSVLVCVLIALFKEFGLFRTQLSKCWSKLSKRIYRWSLKVIVLVIKAKMVLRFWSLFSSFLVLITVNNRCFFIWKAFSWFPPFQGFRFLQ